MKLDLDYPEPLWGIILEDEKGHTGVLELCRANEHLVSSISAYSELPVVLDSTLNAFISSAKERIESVSAYHGCRVFSESDYQERGIKKLEPARVISWCKEFFGHEVRIDEIVSELGSDYISHGESGVFCMRGREAAKKNRSYHSDGSELVRRITNRLGQIEEEKYFSAGKPCHIEVCTPIKWFNENSKTKIECLLRNVFVHWLWVQLELDWPGDPREGGIVFKADIPPELIKAFHYTERAQPVDGGQ